ncbi:MAG: sugar phosphate isomerase/epimerase family protein [Thermoanaerobacterium sp.]|nr:sugar phosphate isomerase/epimerase family protein [Thermoanaerobacterium sp.]
MKLAVSAWSLEKKLFSNEMSIFDFVEFCNGNNIEHMELLDCFWKDENDIDEINKLLSKYNIDVAAYSIGNDFVQENFSERKKQIDAVKKSIDIACRLNTKIVRVFGGDVKKGISFDYAKGWIVESLKECVIYAEQKNVTLVLENHGKLAGKANQIKNIIEEVGSDYLKANADVGNFLLVNEDPYKAIEGLKDYIGYIHLKDLKRVIDEEIGYYSIDGSKYQGTIVGKGYVPIKEIISLLQHVGYNGFLSIEYEGIGDPIQDTIESINIVKLFLT